MPYIKKKPDFPKCTYNEGVCCRPSMRKCHHCGWNPAVARKRNVKIWHTMKG